MVATNTKYTIDQKKETSLIFKDIDDDFVIDLVDYLVEANSVVDSLTFLESSLTRKGIEYLFKKYGDKLLALNMPDNGIGDEDIVGLSFPVGLKSLGLRNNYLSKEVVASLQQLAITLDIEQQNSTSSPESEEKSEPSFLTVRFGSTQQANGMQQGYSEKAVHSKIEEFLSFLEKLDKEKRGLAFDDLSTSMEAKLNVRCQFLEKSHSPEVSSH